ncbi:FlhC family transcriptional regulator [Escherichia coli]
MKLSSCHSCGGNFITHAHQPAGSFVCSLCQPPSRAVKRRKLSDNLADSNPQLLDEQIEQAVYLTRCRKHTPAAVLRAAAFFYPVR